MPKLVIKGRATLDFTTEVEIPEGEIDVYRTYSDHELCYNFTNLENDGDLASDEFEIRTVTYDGKPFEQKREMPLDPILDGRASGSPDDGSPLLQTASDGSQAPLPMSG